MPGKAFATTIANYMGAAARAGGGAYETGRAAVMGAGGYTVNAGRLAHSAAKSPYVRNTALVSGLSMGGLAAGSLGGQVWDARGRGGTGAAIGAGVGLSILGVRGGFARAGASMLSARGLGGAAVGGAMGAFAGPTDSTMANIAMGAGAGMGGAVLGARLGSRMKFGYGGLGQKGFWATTPSVGNRSASFQIGMMGGRHSMKLTTAAIGAGTSALFAPAAAHAMIGGSRRDKRQNSFNRY